MKSILIIFTSIVLVTTLSAQSLFEMDNIATIEIYFPQDNWNQLMIDNYETEEYLIADSVIFNGSMISTKLSATFMIPIKITAFTAFIIAYPMIFYNIWTFVSPGLYKQEKIFTLVIFLLSFVLFILAANFVYFLVFPVIFKFFIAMTPESIGLMIDMTSYLEMIIGLFIAFGIAFQIPLLLIASVKFGLIKRDAFKRNRSYFFVFFFFFGAIFTPPDILSQLLLAVPVYLLYELGILISKRWAAN